MKRKFDPRMQEYCGRSTRVRLEQFTMVWVFARWAGKELPTEGRSTVPSADDLEGCSGRRRSRLVAEVLCGKLQASPFGDLPGRIEGAWAAVLKEAGLEADRREGDRDTLINFRLLQGLVKAFGDPDCGYLGGLAEEGARLGVEVDRVAEVFEEKRRWNLPAVASGDWEELLRDNYSSASRHMEQVRSQLEKDLEKGDLIRMSLADARQRYGARLKVASLAAVPKDAEWIRMRLELFTTPPTVWKSTTGFVYRAR